MNMPKYIVYGLRSIEGEIRRFKAPVKIDGSESDAAEKFLEQVDDPNGFQFEIERVEPA